MRKIFYHNSFSAKNASVDGCCNSPRGPADVKLACVHSDSGGGAHHRSHSAMMSLDIVAVTGGIAEARAEHNGRA